MLEDLQPPTKGYTCKIRTIKDQLDKKDQVILDAALADVSNWPAKTLSNALALRGLTIADNTISRHRKGLCSC